MSFVIKDRVKQLSATSGTGDITLAGQPTGYQSFSVIGDGNTTFYCIVHQSADEWEVGVGTYTASGTTLSRDTVLSSTNGGALVDFSSGTKEVLVTQPSSKAVVRDDNGKVGINTDTPDALLHIAWGDVIIEKSEGSSAELLFHNVGTQVARIGVDSSEDFLIESDGDVNITTPQSGTSSDDIYYSIRQGQVTTTDASSTTVLTIPIAADTTYSVDTKVVGRRTGGSAGSADDGKYTYFSGAFKTASGTVTAIGSPVTHIDVEDQAGFAAGFVISGSNILISVNGTANNDLSWQCTAHIHKVSS